MPLVSAAGPPRTLEMGLCAFVLLLMLIAVCYAGWISFSNYSAIGV